MTDVLIRGLPDDVVAALEARAERLGLSRAEFLRREIIHAAAVGAGPVSVGHLERFGEQFADLADPAVMRSAWE